MGRKRDGLHYTQAQVLKVLIDARTWLLAAEVADQVHRERQATRRTLEGLVDRMLVDRQKTFGMVGIPGREHMGRVVSYSVSDRGVTAYQKYAAKPCFEIFMGQDDQWYWRFVAGNGELLASGAEPFPDKEAAAGAALLCRGLMHMHYVQRPYPQLEPKQR